MKKRILITGVSGMDGSNMVDYLLASTNHDIYGMVRRTSKPDYSNISFALKNPRFKLVVGDLSDGQSIEKVVSEIKPDYFINFAAQSFVKSSWDIPEQTMDINSTGVMRCLEAIVRYVPRCRFYTAGSSEEFGDVQYSPQDEKHPSRARSPYGASKVAARQIVKTYKDSYNLYAIQGLLFNHEGPRRGEEFVTRKITKGVGRINKAIKCNETFEPIILGNIEAKRDWSDSRDFIIGIWLMLNQEQYREDMKGFEQNGCGRWVEGFNNWFDKENNETTKKYAWNFIVNNIKSYILASGETHSVKEFVELAFQRAGIEGVWIGEGINAQFILPSYLSDMCSLKSHVLVKISPEFFRPAEVELLLGDSTLARKELGWKPKYSFQDLVNEMVDNDL